MYEKCGEIKEAKDGKRYVRIVRTFDICKPGYNSYMEHS